MLRRNLLKSLCLIPFSGFIKTNDVKSEIQHKTCEYQHDILGFIQKWSITIINDIQEIFDDFSNVNFRYVHFPRECVIEIEYERGIERYVTYNMTDNDMHEFNVDEFLNSKKVYKDNIINYISWRNYKIYIQSIQIKG